MIARISGRLERIEGPAALVNVGTGLWYEVLVPACDTDRLTARCGQDVVLHTIHYIEGDPARGAQTPRLIGFVSESDREFFELFTTVRGMGMRKALRALLRPPAAVAAAIRDRDAAFLKALPEIGARMAERIIADLHDRLEAFAPVETPGQTARPGLGEAAEDAVAVLVQLGERRGDAVDLVERVLAVAPDAEGCEQILQHAYRLKAGRT